MSYAIPYYQFCIHVCRVYLIIHSLSPDLDINQEKENFVNSKLQETYFSKAKLINLVQKQLSIVNKQKNSYISKISNPS